MEEWGTREDFPNLFVAHQKYRRYCSVGGSFGKWHILQNHAREARVDSLIRDGYGIFELDQKTHIRKLPPSL